jgi:hypothetical protein
LKKNNPYDGEGCQRVGVKKNKGGGGRKSENRMVQVNRL